MRIYPAILPPQATIEAISSFSAKLAASYPDVFGQRASGPHITLRAPQYPNTLEAWMEAAVRCVAGLTPFQVTIGTPTFLSRGVLVLATMSPQLVELNRRLAGTLASFNHPGITYFDYDLYIPHITIAYAPHALMKRRVQLHRHVGNELLPLPAFTASKVSIFVRHDQDFEYRLGPSIALS